MTFSRAVLVILSLIALSIVANAEHLRPLSGGTSTEPDPEHKKHVRVICEGESVRITIGESPREGVFRRGDGMAMIWLKIENRTDSPLSIDSTKWSLVDDQGRGYSGLTMDDAISQLIRAHQGLISFGSAISSGPGNAGESHTTIENMIRHNFEKIAFKQGDIPPRSYKDGVIFVEAPQIKKGAVTLTLNGLWKDPIVLQVTD